MSLIMDHITVALNIIRDRENNKIILSTIK